MTKSGEQLILVKMIHIKNNPADTMTKVVTIKKFKLCTGLIGIDSD